jgi:hypothetical protein
VEEITTLIQQPLLREIAGLPVGLGEIVTVLQQAPVAKSCLPSRPGSCDGSQGGVLMPVNNRNIDCAAQLDVAGARARQMTYPFRVIVGQKPPSRIQALSSSQRMASKATSVLTPDTGPGPDPEHLMQLGLGFWGSRAFLSAIEFDLFSIVAAEGPLSDTQLVERLVNSRSRLLDVYIHILAD